MMYSTLGVVFIVERDTGLLVSATIENQTSSFVEVNQQLVGTRFPASSANVTDYRIREVSRFIESKLDGWDSADTDHNYRASIDGTSFLIDVIPYDRPNLRWAIVLAVPTADILGSINQSSRTSVIVSIVVLVTSLIITVVWTRFVVRPLTQIGVSMEKLSRLEFDNLYARRNSSFSEIRTIEQSYSAMHKGVRSFSKYVPFSVVKGLLGGQHNDELGVQPARVTIMFIDIKGFTTICEFLPAHQTAKILGEFLTSMSNVIIQNQGTVDKYIGDSIMAFWNAPESVPDHAAAACRAALQCYKELSLLHIKWKEQSLPLLDMRIGVHTADILVGNIGSPERMNYTVIGDGVNLASRMESLGKTYGLTTTLVTKTVVKETNEKFLFYILVLSYKNILTLQSQVSVPGRTQTTKVYQLVCKLEEAIPSHFEIANHYQKLFKATQEKDKDAIKEACQDLIALGEDKPHLRELLNDDKVDECKTNNGDV